MRGRSHTAIYSLFVLTPALLVFVLLQLGPEPLALPGHPLTVEAAPAVTPVAATPAASGFSLGLLTLQLAVILLAARLFGAVARRLGQPAVIGEMLAGIGLGPSLLGAVMPDMNAALFPAPSLGFLDALSQLGVLLFLFVVGLHVDTASLRRQQGTALIASHASIAAPFALGAALAHWLFPRYAAPGVSFTTFALFLGVAMSITAFPVLARILEERRLLHTPIGALALACAAVDDVTAWVLLAAVVSLVHSGGALQPLLITVGGTLCFALVMFRVVGPLLDRWATRHADTPQLPASAMSLLLIVVLLAALTTDALGIHALFGAFVAGTIIPRTHALADRVARQLGDLLVVLLLPLFFAYTGLRTDFRGMAELDALLVLAAILAVAIVGKVGGTALAARSSGQSWSDATLLGVLMNTRGLMELVVLNVGLDLGVLSPSLFAMMVIMALVTTMMTVPAMGLFARRLHGA